MMRHFILSLFLLSGAAAMAQPWGPFTVSNESGVRNPQICLRNSDTADVFYQVGDTILHTVVRAESGTILQGPDTFPVEGTGWSRRLCDVISTNEGWAALVYETSAHWHRTVAFWGLDTLFNRAVIDSDLLWHGNMWENASRNSVLTLNPRYPHGFFATWFREENFYNGQFACAQSVSVVLAFVSPDSISPAYWAFQGWPITGQILTIESLLADTTYLFSCNIYDMTICPIWWNDIYNVQISYEPRYANCGSSCVGTLFTHNRAFFSVTRSFVNSYGTQAACVLRVENLSTCTTLRTLSDEPIAGASDRDWGLAWLAWHGPGILLYRADTTGAEYLTQGTVHWLETTIIHEAAIAVSHEGRIAAVWTEGNPGSADATTLRIKSLDWDTPLGASDRDFIPHPSSFVLSCFPNPFNATTQLSFELPRAEKVTLQVFDLLGREVAQIADGWKEAGTHRVTWNAEAQPSGLYFARLTTPDGIRTIKLCLTK